MTTTQFEVHVCRRQMQFDGAYQYPRPEKVWLPVATVPYSESAGRLAVELLADEEILEVRVSRVKVERPEEAT